MSEDSYVTRQSGGATVIQLSRPAPVDSVVVVTMEQARRALLQAGLLGAVEASIAALPEPDRSQAQITWEFKTQVSRTGPLVLLIAGQLGLTEAQIDALFAAAATIT
ncbi:MAG: hypothetical protein ACT6S0_04945 [Roseateles sp.]|uniref:hypothetical protein n=1 Tax=Roseateles sp. TaxID=1971397 RepID=UPI004036ACCE